ncbi:MAG: septation regulator SpoVG [Bacillota bacterium]|nr:septation regulator SpoVG [Bacillota bacterium]
MEITDIIVRQLQETGKLKAVVSVTFDNCFVVHDVKVIESMNGLFIAMPSRRTPNNNFIDIVHPINSEFRQTMSDAVLAAYRESLRQREEELRAEQEQREPEPASFAYFGDRPTSG